MAYLDVVELRYSDSEGDTHSLFTSRLDVRIIDPVRDPLPNQSLPLTIGGVVVLLLAAIAILKWNERQKAKQRAAEEAQKPQTPEEKYLLLLKTTVQPDGQELSREYAQLATVLRGYLHEAVGLDVESLTTQGLVDSLEARRIEMGTIQSIQEILQACDLVKFSGGSADATQLAQLCSRTEKLMQNGVRQNAEEENESASQ